jgi:hypothetical protein
MVFPGRLPHLFQEYLVPIGLSIVLCMGIGAAIGLLCFFYAEPYSLVMDVRKRASWIAAVSGSIVCCCMVFVFGSDSDSLTFAGFLFFGAVTSSGAGLLPLTVCLPALRRAAGVSKDGCVRSPGGKERLKD